MQRHLRRHDAHPTNRGGDSPARRLRVSLEIVRGQTKQRVRRVAGPAFLIGSAADCDLVLADAQFPEVHAYLRVEAEQVSLRHLGFEPAIAVNDQVVNRAILVEGDRIRSGPYEFLVHVEFETSDRDDLDGGFDLDLPAAGDAVEESLGAGLVQELLDDIRPLVQPIARLKLYKAADAEGGAESSDAESSDVVSGEADNSVGEGVAASDPSETPWRHVHARSI